MRFCQEVYDEPTITLFFDINEQYGDSTQLIYLRARYYNPTDGRFQSRDTWSGDYNNPLSLNRWMYVDGNPVNYTNPSGNIKNEPARVAKADLIAEKLHDIYNVNIEKDWGYRLIPFGSLYYSGCKWQEGNWHNAHELELVFEGVKAMAKKLGGPNKFISALKGMPITIKRMPEDLYEGKYVAWTFFDIKLYDGTFNNINDPDRFASGTVVHELAHVWDTRQWISQLSDGMNSQTKSFKQICEQGPTRGVPPCHLVYDKNNQEAPPSSYATGSDAVSGPREDFADSFVCTVTERGLRSRVRSKMPDNGTRGA